MGTRACSITYLKLQSLVTYSINDYNRIAHIYNPPLVAAAEECAEFPQCTNCRLGGPMLKLAKLVVCVCEFSISLVFVCLELVVPPTYVYEYIQI